MRHFDYAIEGCSGLTFVERITDPLGLLSYPVLLLTNSANAYMASEARHLGVHDCLVKDSMTGPHLAWAVRNAIQKHRLQLEKKRDAERARTSEKRFRSLTETVPCFVWTAQTDGSVEFCGSHWCDYSGLTSEDAQSAGWLKALHPDDFARGWKEWGDAVSSGTTFERQYQLRRHDGVYRWFALRAVLLRDDNERSLQWLGTCTDIDDVITLQIELANRTDQLARSNRDLNSLAHAVGDTLKSPTGGVTH